MAKFRLCGFTYNRFLREKHENKMLRKLHKLFKINCKNIWPWVIHIERALSS